MNICTDKPFYSRVAPAWTWIVASHVRLLSCRFMLYSREEHERRCPYLLGTCWLTKVQHEGRFSFNASPIVRCCLVLPQEALLLESS